MGTRIVIGGRVQWATPDHIRAEMRKRADRRIEDPLTDDGVAPADRPENKYIPISDPRPMPAALGGTIKDDDGIVFRIVSKLNLQEGWCLASQLMQHYRVPYAVIIDWALKGLVDPVMEHRSPTKRFRVRDDDRCRKSAAAWKASQKKGRQR